MTESRKLDNQGRLHLNKENISLIINILFNDKADRLFVPYCKQKYGKFEIKIVSVNIY